MPDFDLDLGNDKKIWLNGAVLSNNGVYSLMKRMHSSASRCLTNRDIVDCALQLNFGYPYDIFSMPEWIRAQKSFPLDLDHPDRQIPYKWAVIWILTLTQCSRKVGLLGGTDESVLLTVGDDDEE